MVERAEKQVHANDSQRFLLIYVPLVEHPNVNHNLAWLATGLVLETDAEPAVRFVVLLETARRHRIGKNKKCPDAAELFVEPLDQKAVLVVEHRLQPVAADVALSRSVDRVAKRHVVSGHRFGDGAGRAAHVKKSPCYFLPSANLGECPVLLRVEIYLERFLVRPQIHLRLHRSSRCGTFPQFTTVAASALISGLLL